MPTRKTNAGNFPGKNKANLHSMQIAVNNSFLKACMNLRAKRVETYVKHRNTVVVQEQCNLG